MDEHGYIRDAPVQIEKNETEILREQMTKKQENEKRVSTYDHTSILGKLLCSHRGNLRNFPCSCGSGKKFKNCCW